MIHQIFPLARDWWNRDPWPERTLSANNPRLANKLRNEAFFVNLLMRKLGNLLRNSARKHQEVDVFCFVFCFVLFCAAAFAVRGNIWRIIKTINYFRLRKYARIVVLGHDLFLEAHSSRSLLGTDNILGQLSMHISSPKVVYCFFIRNISFLLSRLKKRRC